MFKLLFLSVRYPYVAGMIGIVWLGLGILVYTIPHLPVFKMFLINLGASVFMAWLGFRGRR